MATVLPRGRFKLVQSIGSDDRASECHRGRLAFDGCNFDISACIFYEEGVVLRGIKIKNNVIDIYSSKPGLD
jgi:hypothetical protein